MQESACNEKQVYFFLSFKWGTNVDDNTFSCESTLYPKSYLLSVILSSLTVTTNPGGKKTKFHRCSAHDSTNNPLMAFYIQALCGVLIQDSVTLTLWSIRNLETGTCKEFEPRNNKTGVWDHTSLTHSSCSIPYSSINIIINSCLHTNCVLSLSLPKSFHASLKHYNCHFLSYMIAMQIWFWLLFIIRRVAQIKKLFFSA